MGGERITLDTNILVCAVDRDAGERHARAAASVDAAVDLDCVLTLQALSEFFATVTRKGMMAVDAAAAQVEDWQLLAKRDGSLGDASHAKTPGGNRFFVLLCALFGLAEIEVFRSCSPTV
ncbi:MAG: PIN domain-containing protein [Deferrisomatales bacterium]